MPMLLTVKVRDKLRAGSLPKPDHQFLKVLALPGIAAIHRIWEVMGPTF
jgi:hypothetical protein